MFLFIPDLSCCVILGNCTPSLSCSISSSQQASGPLPPSPPRAKFPKAENARGQSSVMCLVSSRREKLLAVHSSASLSFAGRDGAGLRPGATQDLPGGLRLPQERGAAGLPLQENPGEWSSGRPALRVHGHDHEGHAGVWRTGGSAGATISNTRGKRCQATYRRRPVTSGFQISNEYLFGECISPTLHGMYLC